MADLYGAALAHLRLAERRVPGTPVVRICTPTFDEHGYESMHTILQMVTDDMPFLVDSVSMELDRHGVGIHLVIHPIIRVRRSADGAMLEVLDDQEGHDTARDGVIAEAFMHFEIDRETDRAILDDLASDVRRVLDDVRPAVADWEEMRARSIATVDDLATARLPVPDIDVILPCALRPPDFDFGFVSDFSGRVFVTSAKSDDD